MKKILNRIVILFCAAIAVMAFTACSVKIADINVPAEIVVNRGETATVEIGYIGSSENVEAEDLLEAAEKAGVTWTIADENIATVTGGTITGVNAGETELTVQVGELSKTIQIKVVVPLEKVEAPAEMSLIANSDTEKTKALDARLVPEDATGVALTYESSDPEVATVDEQGNVTAVSNGECTITTKAIATGESATAESSTSESATAETAGADPEAWSATTKVTVTTVATAIELDKSEGILYIGNTHTIKATVTPDEVTDATITWTSSDESVATVNENGKVTAKSSGSATITATCGDVSASYALTVQKRPVAASTSGTSGGSSSASGGTSAPAVTSPTVTAPAPTVTESAPAADPAPAPAPEPAPAPDPAPAPEQNSGPVINDSDQVNIDEADNAVGTEF